MSPVDHVLQKCHIVIHEAPPIISNSYNLNNILKPHQKMLMGTVVLGNITGEQHTRTLSAGTE